MCSAQRINLDFNLLNNPFTEKFKKIGFYFFHCVSGDIHRDFRSLMEWNGCITTFKSSLIEPSLYVPFLLPFIICCRIYYEKNRLVFIQYTLS